MPRDSQLAQIHIARKELGLDEDTYRDVLERITGQRSAARLPPAVRHDLLREFRRMGWKGGFAGRQKSKKAYVRKVFALWGQLKRDQIWREPDVASLRRFVEKLTGCADPEWMSYDQASRVIEALKKMEERGQ